MYRSARFTFHLFTGETMEQCTIHATRIQSPTITNDYATRFAFVVSLPNGDREVYDRVAVVSGTVTFQARTDDAPPPHALAVLSEDAVIVATRDDVTVTLSAAGTPAEKHEDAATVCPNCGADGPHFVPPSLGESGFYLCTTPREQATATPLAQADGAPSVEGP